MCVRPSTHYEQYIHTILITPLPGRASLHFSSWKYASSFMSACSGPLSNLHSLAKVISNKYYKVTIVSRETFNVTFHEPAQRPAKIIY